MGSDDFERMKNDGQSAVKTVRTKEDHMHLTEAEWLLIATLLSDGTLHQPG
jgi:hypothetical protein